jgi:putative transposase
VNTLVTLGVSVNRACQLVQLARASFHYQARAHSDQQLVAELQVLAEQQPRYGYRRAWALLRRRRIINHKRVHRVWKLSGLQVKRARRVRHKPERQPALVAAYPNHIWAYDFVQDRDQRGNTLYILTVLDEFTREAFAIDVELETSAERVKEVLKQIVARYGRPEKLRSDNGAEFVAKTLQSWLAGQDIEPLSIEPGSPWQNGKDERFNGTVRDECLNLFLFANLAEARVRLEAFRHHYNSERPHSQLGYRTPLEFKQTWSETQTKQSDSLIPT